MLSYVARRVRPAVPARYFSRCGPLSLTRGVGSAFRSFASGVSSDDDEILPLEDKREELEKLKKARKDALLKDQTFRNPSLDAAIVDLENELGTEEVLASLLIYDPVQRLNIAVNGNLEDYLKRLHLPGVRLNGSSTVLTDWKSVCAAKDLRPDAQLKFQYPEYHDLRFNQRMASVLEEEAMNFLLGTHLKEGSRIVMSGFHVSVRDGKKEIVDVDAFLETKDEIYVVECKTTLNEETMAAALAQMDTYVSEIDRGKNDVLFDCGEFGYRKASDLKGKKVIKYIGTRQVEKGDEKSVTTQLQEKGICIIKPNGAAFSARNMYGRPSEYKIAEKND